MYRFAHFLRKEKSNKDDDCDGDNQAIRQNSCQWSITGNSGNY